MNCPSTPDCAASSITCPSEINVEAVFMTPPPTAVPPVPCHKNYMASAKIVENDGRSKINRLHVGIGDSRLILSVETFAVGIRAKGYCACPVIRCQYQIPVRSAL